MFITEESLKSSNWRAFERVVARLLIHEGYEEVRLIGQTGDKGADILAHRFGKRWLFQVKHWKKRISIDVVDKTLEAMRLYRANIPAIVALNGFDDAVREHQSTLHSRQIPLQLWDKGTLLNKVQHLPLRCPEQRTPRQYQSDAIQILVQTYFNREVRKCMVVLATGLGKTFTAAEALRRIGASEDIRALVIAHTNELVYQLEKAFWPCLTSHQETLVWNGLEQPSLDDMARVPFVFACLNTVAEAIVRGNELPPFDIILIDECHHVGGQMYRDIIQETQAGTVDGPFLVGLTATPWRADEVDLQEYFGSPLVTVDIVAGLRRGFLSNVDYRIHTDNINWEALSTLEGTRFTPRQINRTLFITEWDDAVVYKLQDIWLEQPNPRALVFCGTIDHAITMSERINALGFCNSAAIYSKDMVGRSMSVDERGRIISDFYDGEIEVLCAVDILNEGIDIPDVNILVFQRVTHSRRIFVQQLGRGLRIAPGKEKVIVLDFVSDIRRFAAGLRLKNDLEDSLLPGKPMRVRLGHKVTFERKGGTDTQTETFLRHWIEDIAAIEGAGQDASVLKFPPDLD